MITLRLDETRIHGGCNKKSKCRINTSILMGLLTDSAMPFLDHRQASTVDSIAAASSGLILSP